LNPLISIIIPTHNSESTIKSCLSSLVYQSIPREQYEIIVVDDGSNDNTVPIAKESGVDSVIITEPCFQGKARNIGAKNSKSEFLAFIDSDCVAKKDWIKSILTELNKSEAVTGPIENGNPQNKIAWSEYLIEFGGWDEFQPRSLVRFLPGCNQAIIKKIFTKAGGFTEIPSSEDVLFGESLREVGINPIFEPSIRIEHMSRTNKVKVLKNLRLLGKYSVIARKGNLSIAYSSFFISKKFVPILFFGKIIKTFYRSIKAKKFTKFIVSFSLIIEGIASYCKGYWEELK